MDIRELGPGDDPGALLDLSVRAFGPIARADQPRWRESSGAAIAAGRYLGAFGGGRMLAAAQYHDMIQWWHGRPVPMAGVANVMVAPEERGRGAGRTLMRALLGLIGERGYPVSALYPATMALYRSLGWEIAGSLSRLAIPSHALRSLVSPDAALPRDGPAPGGPAPATRRRWPHRAGPDPGLRRVGPGDAAEVLTVTGRVHQDLRDCGPNTRDEPSVALWLGGEHRFAYLAPDAFLAYRWQQGNDELLVERAVASSAAATRALWGVVASHSSIAQTVRAAAAPADPVQWLTTDPEVRLTARKPWMLRVVDAAAAVAARGFPPGVGLTAVLRLADPDRPGQDGWWTLDVGGGTGTLTPAGPGPGALALGPRGFAALYAGIPLATLRRAGLAAGGDPGADAALDAAFGADAFMLEFF